MTTPDALPVGSGGMSEEWRDYALHLRNVLEQLGAGLAPCLPGEANPCGGDYAHHCLSYLAALQARAEFGIRHLAHGDAESEFEVAQALDFWRAEFEKEAECRHDGDEPGQPPRLPRSR